jgi:prepilin-type N-terminal cleavage/methylation domain-containing protein
MIKSKGFTLIELLVVIAIVAVLAVVVILTLNPAELLRQARDSNRVSDAATMKSALALYLADVTSAQLGNIGDAGVGTQSCYESSGLAPGAAGCGVFTGTAVGYAASSGRASSTATARNVDGTGWIPVNFTAISSKSPIANLPVDPVNNLSFYYAYAATGSAAVSPAYKFMIKAVESAKYNSGGPGDVVSTDGGYSSSSLEFGSNMTL